MSGFKLEKDVEEEYERMIINCTYALGKKREAEKAINEWIKEHPEVGEGYEVKCNWEFQKEFPDMAKIARILKKANNNGTFVPNEYMYREVIEYYKRIKDTKNEEYFSSILNFLSNGLLNKFYE